MEPRAVPPMQPTAAPPRRRTLAGLEALPCNLLVALSCLSNIALLVYCDLGLSVQVMQRSTAALVVSGRCLAADNERLEATNLTGMVSMVAECALGCGARLFDEVEPGQLACTGECLHRDRNLSHGCASCFDSTSRCLLSNCLSDCIGGASAGCVDCGDAACMPTLVNGCGIVAPLGSRHHGAVLPPTPPSSPPQLVAPSEAYKPIGADGDITYVYTVRRAWEGRAYAIGVAIVLCSGVWPYLSNVLFLTAWFAPLRPRFRAQLIAWTNRCDRWALMDVMVVCVIIAMFDLQLASLGLEVVAEARVAIVTFAIASVHSIVMGALIARRSDTLGHGSVAEDAACSADELDRLGAVDAVHLGCCGTTHAAGLERAVHGHKLGRLLWPVSSSAALGLMAASLATPAVELTIFEGTRQREVALTLITIGTEIWPTPEVTQPAPAACMIVTYFVLGVFAALASAGLGALASISSLVLPPAASVTRLLVELADRLAPFAAYDVLAAAILVSTTEYSKLVNAILASILGQSVGTELPVRAEATPGTAAWIMIAASFIFWLSALLTAMDRKRARRRPRPVAITGARALSSPVVVPKFHGIDVGAVATTSAADVDRVDTTTTYVNGGGGYEDADGGGDADLSKGGGDTAMVHDAPSPNVLPVTWEHGADHASDN